MELSKILIVHTGGGLGDVLVSTPVIEALHLNFPQAQIDFLARQSTAAAVRHNPWITDVYTIDKPKLNISEIFAWSRKLREQHYDCALILWSTASLAFTLYLARIPVRVGQDSRFFYSWSYTHRVRIRSEHGDTKSHWSEVMLDFVRSLNIPVQPCQPRFFVTDEAKLKAQELLKELPVGHGFSVRLEGRGRDFLKNLSKNLSAQTEGSPIVGFHVGKGVDYSKVKWPVEHFACWAKALEEKRQARLVFTGSAQERPTVEAIIAQAQLSSCLNLAGQTDVDTMAAVISQCQFFVCPDSGPGHLAAACGIPTLDIFALKEDFPERWRPLGAPTVVLRPTQWKCSRTCYKQKCPDFACYEEISVDEFLEGFDKLTAQIRTKVENKQDN